MELTVFLTSLALVFKLGLAVQCYKCEAQWNGDKNQLCNHINHSNQSFIVNCNLSTMCYKKEVFMDVGSGKPIKAVSRGCAPQTIKDDQKLMNGSWHYVYDIHEVYEEKCHVDNFYDEGRTKNTYCYCRGDLCNGASGIGKGFQYLCAVVIGFTVLWRI